MTTALAFNPLTQFGELEAQVGISHPGNDSDCASDWSRVENLLAEASRALRSGDTARFNVVLAELGTAAAPPAKKLELINAADWIETEPPPPDQILGDTFDAGDKVAVIGASKRRKSFFVLQLALHLAAGRDFLVWKVPRPRKVLLVQMEVKTDHFHRRLRRMAEILGLSRDTVGDNLRIINSRGEEHSMEAVGASAREIGAEMIIFDPLYKLVAGDENASVDLKPVLKEFDRLAGATGAAVAYVHHDAKGNAGDRIIRGRGAGSNVLGRDYDCCITLTGHRDDPDAVVVEVLLRNYKPQEPFAIGWCEGSFRTADLAPVAATSRNSSSDSHSKKPAEEYVDKAVELMKQPLTMKEFGDLLITRLGLAQMKARAVQDSVLRSGKLKKTSRRYEKGGPVYIGTPGAIDDLEVRLQDQKLPGIDREALQVAQVPLVS